MRGPLHRTSTPLCQRHTHPRILNLMSMHILFVTAEYPPISGGVGAYTAELGRALVEQGIEVSVLTTYGLPADSAPKEEHISLYPMLKRWDGRIWPMVRKIAAQIEADWVHIQYQTGAYSMRPAINFAPLYWQRESNLKLAWTYHDLLVPYLFPKATQALRNWVTEFPCTYCDLVIATNQSDWQQLQPKVAQRSEITCTEIPIGSNIKGQQLDEHQRRQQRAKYGYTDGHTILAYFGFLNRSKGVLTLIKTIHRLREQHPNIRLLMIGDKVGANDPTNFAYLQEVENLISELGLGDIVQWTGHQDDEEVGANLNAADFLVMLYEDGASLRRGTLMAGLVNGCAIITTTPQAPLPELAHERDLCYVDPGDAQGAAQQIDQLIRNPDLVQQLRQNAREQSQLFNWQTIAQQHIALYGAK